REAEHGPRAEVVPDQEGAIGPESFERRRDVGLDVLRLVRLDVEWTLAPAVASHVERDRAVTGLGERRELVPERVREAREPVAHEDERPLARREPEEAHGAV